MKETPQTKLHGWWWKRFFPKYRRLQKLAQTLSDATWNEEEHTKKVCDAILNGKFHDSDFVYGKSIKDFK